MGEKIEKSRWKEYICKPLNRLNIDEPLTAAEMGKLRATYMGNSMAKCVLNYYLQHVEDEDIKTLLENALKLAEDFLKTTTDIFNKENFPIPKGLV